MEKKNGKDFQLGTQDVHMAAQRTAPAESRLSSLFTWELLWLAWAPTSPTKGWNPRQNFLPFILTGSLHTVSAC